MPLTQRTKDALKSLSRKFLGYDPSLRGVALGADFLDQKSLLAGSEAKVIFDVGANVGQTTRKYRKLFPLADVYAFEPFPDTFKTYLANTRGDRRVHANNLALSDEAGTATFHANSNHYTNSLLEVSDRFKGESNYKASSVIEVPTQELDSFCRSNTISRIDVLKMDVQGGELLVLRGARQMLREGAIRLVYTEVEFEQIYEGQPLLADIQAFLEEFGYVLRKTYNEEPGPSGKKLSADAIFTKA